MSALVTFIDGGSQVKLFCLTCGTSIWMWDLGSHTPIFINFGSSFSKLHNIFKS